MPMNLPIPVATFLAADRASDLTLLDQCFAPDALVHDESHDYHGLAEIKSWLRDAKAKYQYSTEPLDADVRDDVVKLRARLTGNFPGSPIEVVYTFTIKDGKIAALEIK
jgi:hypothetical protein